MFIAALFIIAKSWKQPKCPLTDKWKKKKLCVCVYTHNGILAIKKNKIVMLFAAAWMNLEIIIVTEASQVKTAHHDTIYMCSLKEMGRGLPWWLSG